MANSYRNLRGSILGSADVKALTGWPQLMIEDYLSIRDNFVTVAIEADTKSDKIKIVYNVGTTPYTVPADADALFVDTNSGDVVLNLPAGVEGTYLRIINTGTSGNVVYPTPNGTELLFGLNVAEPLYDYEVFVINYSNTYGWF